MRSLTTTALTALTALTLSLGCGPAGVQAPQGEATRGKADTGWQADTSFEVEALFSGAVTHAASGSYADLATDRSLQETLIDQQIKYGKATMLGHRYQLNQLAESVKIVEVSTDEDDGAVTVRYQAIVDLIHPKRSHDEVPTLEAIDPLVYTLQVPMDPIGVYYRAGESCAADWDPYTLSDKKYYYYFAPDKEGCDEPMLDATLQITKVHPIRTAYPEYDQLLKSLDDQGHLGFSVALLPNLGDDDPAGRFERHKRMLEQKLKLTGQPSADGTYVRFVWTGEASSDGEGDGAKASDVQMVIDLFDPTKGWFTSTFRKALGQHEVVFYNGHSNYGTQPFLTNPDAFSKGYQIVFMHACRTYAYYTRQVFRAKASAADPTGQDLADVVASGRSTSPYDSPRTLEPLLRSLMQGVVAVHTGKADQAPTWLSIISKMNSKTWDKLYGAAGVRNNSWTPGNI